MSIFSDIAEWIKTPLFWVDVPGTIFNQKLTFLCVHIMLFIAVVGVKGLSSDGDLLKRLFMRQGFAPSLNFGNRFFLSFFF